MNHTRFSLGLIVLFSLMLSGCQSIISQFSQPEIQSVRIYPNINTLTTGELTVELDVFNPNFIGIDPETLDLALAVNGKSILSANSTDLPNLPANGSATIKTDVRLGWNEIQEISQAMRQNLGQPLDYSLTGNLDTGAPLIGNIPVKKTGSWQFSDLFNF